MGRQVGQAKHPAKKEKMERQKLGHFWNIKKEKNKQRYKERKVE